MKKTLPRLLQTPPASPSVARRHFAAKLALETDPSDVYEALQSGSQAFVVVDGRSPESYRRGHVQGAISLWHRNIDKAGTATLDKKKLYVTYCTGVGCNASTKAAYKLSKLGFKVKEMVGGLAWWKQEGYPVAKA
jgi:rhodanese-related sulfurtransferase